MIRNEYHFDRPLSDYEGHLLLLLIAWRRGSRIGKDHSGAVIACVAHPDDVAEFEKQVRRSGKRNAPRAVKVEPAVTSSEAGGDRE